MRNAILAIIFAIAVVGAGAAIATFADLDQAVAGCSSRC